MGILHDFPAAAASATAQNDSAASPAPKVHKSFAKVSFRLMSRSEIFNVFRSISHIHHIETLMHTAEHGTQTVRLCEVVAPSAASITNMSAVQFASFDAKCEPGSIFLEKTTALLWIKCACFQWLAVKKFRVYQRNLLHTASSLVNGYHLKNWQLHFE